MGSIIVLVLILWLLIQTPYVQNRLVDNVLKTISKNLKTTISIGSVNFSLFNKFDINDVLVIDRSKDTLLYAGHIRFNISDWFFLKKDIAISYAGLEDVYINTYRKDSTWNYQFIMDALSSEKQSNGKPTALKLNIGALDLKKIRYTSKDEWRGEDQDLTIAKLSLSAGLIDLKNKKIQLNILQSTNLISHCTNTPARGPSPWFPKRKKESTENYTGIPDSGTSLQGLSACNQEISKAILQPAEKPTTILMVPTCIFQISPRASKTFS